MVVAPGPVLHRTQPWRTLRKDTQQWQSQLLLSPFTERDVLRAAETMRSCTSYCLFQIGQVHRPSNICAEFWLWLELCVWMQSTISELRCFMWWHWVETNDCSPVAETSEWRWISKLWRQLEWLLQGDKTGMGVTEGQNDTNTQDNPAQYCKGLLLHVAFYHDCDSGGIAGRLSNKQKTKDRDQIPLHPSPSSSPWATH